jgi:hypothetical protein
MKSKRIHRIIGLLLVLPIIGWTFTGIIFFIKPGYQAAYDQLTVKTYPLEKSFVISISKEWTEVKIIKTILGYHLLVKTDNGFKHLDPITFEPKPPPIEAELNSLLNDSFSNNSERYGHVISNEGFKVLTSKAIEVTLNWERLVLRQKGEDTKLINMLYKIHYLQWTPFKGINKYMGIMGLILLMTLTVFGIKLYLSGRQKKSPDK